MKQTHDIFLRAYAVAAEQNRQRKPESRISTTTNKWPEHALIVDVESRVTADQSLTFGVFRLCTLRKGVYRVTREGIVYADDLPARDRKVLKAYQQTAISDVRSFPPEFPLHSRCEFMKKIFYPAMKRDGALITGLGISFDLSRLALDWDKGGKGGSDRRKWSLTMSRYPNGKENKNCRRVRIEPIDSKKAFISLASEWVPKGRTKEWKHVPHFLDIRTLGWALFNRSFSLRSLCRELQTEHQKLDHEPTGRVTPEEIDYARQDGRCTVDALNALKHEFDKHPIGLKPYYAYSPASVAKSYLEAMGITKPAEKFNVSEKELGIGLQSYYGGRSETRIRCTEVPVVPVDFVSQYPTCCALLSLFDVLTAESVSFDDDTENIRRLLKSISLDQCFEPALWKSFKFFALMQPDGDILPVRTVYDGVTQNIGNNYLTSDVPIWFAGCDLIASVIRTRKVPRILRAIRMIPHGKQAGMKPVNLRDSMVEIDPYKDDLFRKVIEQRKLHKADKALYYWLKILANSIYGFFVELNPELRSKKVLVNVWSGEKNLIDSTDVTEKEGQWFFPPLASLITSAGRLLLAMAEACVEEKKGTYIFCDTDSLACISAEVGGPLDIPGGKGLRILSWKEVNDIVDRFASLNPYSPEAVRGSILNLVDANYVGSDPTKPQRQLYGFSISAKRYALYERIGTTDIKIVDPKAHGIGFLYPPKDSPDDWDEDVPQWIYEMWDYIVRGALKLNRKEPSWLDTPQMMRLTITTPHVLDMLGEWDAARPYNFLFLPMVDPTFGYAFDRRSNEKILLVCPYSTHQERWFQMECVNVHNGKKYKMVDCTKEKNPDHNVVFPSQFARLMVQYQEHPEAKSLAPDGTPCKADTKGLLKRAHIIAGELRYVGKETDRKWEEGDEISVLEFKTTEYGRSKMVVASEEVKKDIRRIGINKCARESGFDRKNIIRKLVRDIPVKRNSYAEFEHWLKSYKSQVDVKS